MTNATPPDDALELAKFIVNNYHMRLSANGLRDLIMRLEAFRTKAYRESWEAGRDAADSLIEGIANNHLEVPELFVAVSAIRKLLQPPERP